MPTSYNIEIANTWTTCSFNELCQISCLDSEFIEQCVEYGIVNVQGNTADEWAFNIIAMNRIQKAFRLKRDLGINHSGLALALELLDEIDGLKKEVFYLRKKITHWENISGEL